MISFKLLAYFWRLNTTPKAKFFVWLLFHGRNKTLGFLYDLNLASNFCCAICGHHRENINNLFHSCSMILLSWRKIEEITNVNFFSGNNIHIGVWLENIGSCKAKWIASIIVTAIWNIWESWFNIIFKGQQFDPNWVATSFIAQVKECSRRTDQ